MRARSAGPSREIRPVRPDPERCSPGAIRAASPPARRPGASVIVDGQRCGARRTSYWNARWACIFSDQEEVGRLQIDGSREDGELCARGAALAIRIPRENPRAAVIDELAMADRRGAGPDDIP